MLNRIIFNAIFFASLSSFAGENLTCENGKFRSVIKGKTEFIDSLYCYDATKTQLFSKSCELKSCPAFSYPESLNFREFLGPYGNPAFGVCRKVGGIPEILEFKADNKWYKLDRCLFKDGSYVSTDYLAHFYFHMKPKHDLGL